MTVLILPPKHLPKSVVVVGCWLSSLPRCRCNQITKSPATQTLHHFAVRCHSRRSQVTAAATVLRTQIQDHRRSQTDGELLVTTLATLLAIPSVCSWSLHRPFLLWILSCAARARNRSATASKAMQCSPPPRHLARWQNRNEEFLNTTEAQKVIITECKGIFGFSRCYSSQRSVKGRVSILASTTK